MAGGHADPTSPAEPDAADATLVRAVRGLASIVAPTTLLAALLFYFGWVWTDAEARYLGLDESLMGFSTEDFLLRSVSAAFLPLMVALLVGLCATIAYGVLIKWIEQAPATPALVVQVSFAAVGVVLLATAAIGALTRSDGGNNLFTPLALAGGTAFTSFAGLLWNAHRRARDPGTHLAGVALLRALVLLLISLSLFWEVSIYANYIGIDAGERLIAGLACRPDAILYSDQRLHLDGPGVSEEALPGSGTAETFRYNGLKLLLHTNGRYFLLPSGWSLDDARTVIVADEVVGRLELRRAC